MGKNKNQSGNKKYHPYNKDHKRTSNNSGSIPIGIKGFLCTFNTMKKQSERSCIREAFNVLNEYVEKMNEIKNTEEIHVDTNKDAVTKVKDDDEEIDIEDALKSELCDLKQDTDVRKHKFQHLDSGAQGNVFIKINDRTIDPVTLGVSIVRDLYETKQQKTINLLRLIPVEVTCKSYVDDISKAIVPLIDTYFAGEPTSFCVVFNKRNNNNLERASVIEIIALLVKEKNMFHSVDLKQAALTIVVEVIKSVCCIGVLPEYWKYKKYNLCEITYPEKKLEPTKTIETNEDKKEEEKGEKNE